MVERWIPRKKEDDAPLSGDEETVFLPLPPRKPDVVGTAIGSTEDTVMASFHDAVDEPIALSSDAVDEPGSGIRPISADRVDEAVAPDANDVSGANEGSGPLDFLKEGLESMIAAKLIRSGGAEFVASRVGDLPKSDQQASLVAMLDVGDLAAFEKAVAKVNGLPIEMAREFLGAGLLPSELMDNVGAFEVNAQRILASRVISAGKGNEIAARIDKFDPSLRAEIADVLINAGEAWHVIMRIRQFGLDEAEEERIVARIEDIGTR